MARSTSSLILPWPAETAVAPQLLLGVEAPTFGLDGIGQDAADRVGVQAGDRELQVMPRKALVGGVGAHAVRSPGLGGGVSRA